MNPEEGLFPGLDGFVLQGRHRASAAGFNPLDEKCGVPEVFYPEGVTHTECSRDLPEIPCRIADRKSRPALCGK